LKTSGNIAFGPGEPRPAVVSSLAEQLSPAALTSKSGLSVTLLRNYDIEEPTWALPLCWYTRDEVPACFFIHLCGLAHAPYSIAIRNAKGGYQHMTNVKDAGPSSWNQAHPEHSGRATSSTTIAGLSRVLLPRAERRHGMDPGL